MLAWGPITAGPGNLVTDLALAALLGLANTAVGVAVHQALLQAVRAARRSRARSRAGQPGQAS